jgi:capsular polysaccharide biosynthesis protein
MDSSTDVSDYLGMLRRHWWVVLLLAFAGVGAAVLVTHVQPKVYESATSVLVQPAGQDTNVVGGRTKGDINLDTEAQLVHSTAVAVGAAELLRTGTPPDELARQVAVEVPANTAVLVVTFTAGEPESARAGSHAFAEAYLRNREESAKADLNAQIGALNAKVRQLSTTLSQVNGRLAGLSDSSPLRPNLESQRNTTQNQLNNLSGKLNDLTTATVTGGKIISDARLPGAPTKPDPMLNLATGAMLGLLLGVGVGLVRERLDRRVRTAADVSRRTGVPVLAELAGIAHLDGVLPPHEPGGRTFNRLRNEVVASLGPDDKVVVVAGASRGVASTLVAANLAAALARTGSDVTLVGAHLPDSVADAAPLATIFGVAATPGLSDVLAGRVGLAAAVQHAPRIPSLRVITTGSTASAAGLMQSQGLRDALDLLGARPGYVVIEAPATSSSADAQSLASLADAAIITVELRRTRRPDVSDAAEQLRRVGTPLLGAVVVPRMASGPVAPGPRPAAPARALPAAPASLPPEEPADLSSAGLAEVDLTTSTAVIRLPPGTRR